MTNRNTAADKIFASHARRMAALKVRNEAFDAKHADFDAKHADFDAKHADFDARALTAQTRQAALLDTAPRASVTWAGTARVAPSLEAAHELRRTLEARWPALVGNVTVRAL